MALDLTKAIAAPELGKLLGVTHRCITDWRARGLPLPPHGRIRLGDALGWVASHVDTFRSRFDRGAHLAASLLAEADQAAANAEQASAATDNSAAGLRHRALRARAQLLETRAQAERGLLIDKEKGKRLVWAWARQIRDHWLAFPARFSAEHADDLGVDRRVLQVTLDQAVRKQINETANTQPPL